MFGTLKALMTSLDARAEEQMRSRYAIELIEQKIREAEVALTSAKGTLASLIQRQRAEAKMLDSVHNRIADLTERAKLALDDKNESIASQAAHAIAVLENERESRQQTAGRLETRIDQLRQSVDQGHRRLIDLKQGLTSARAVRQEQAIQRKMTTNLRGPCSAAEAEALIAQVHGQDDPFEQSEILSEIDRDLNNDSLADRMAAKGYGTTTKTTAADVLTRLKSS